MTHPYQTTTLKPSPRKKEGERKTPRKKRKKRKKKEGTNNQRQQHPNLFLNPTISPTPTQPTHSPSNLSAHPFPHSFTNPPICSSIPLPSVHSSGCPFHSLTYTSFIPVRTPPLSLSLSPLLSLIANALPPPSNAGIPTYPITHCYPHTHHPYLSLHLSAHFHILPSLPIHTLYSHTPSLPLTAPIVPSCCHPTIITSLLSAHLLSLLVAHLIPPTVPSLFHALTRSTYHRTLPFPHPSSTYSSIFLQYLVEPILLTVWAFAR